MALAELVAAGHGSRRPPVPVRAPLQVRHWQRHHLAGLEQPAQPTLGSIALSAKSAVALNGSGIDGRPLGIINTCGIGSVTGTSLALAGVLEFQTDIGDALGDRCGYATTRTVTATLAARAALVSGTERTLWTGNLYRGDLGGHQATTSPNVPASHLVFSAWPDIVRALELRDEYEAQRLAARYLVAEAVAERARAAGRWARPVQFPTAELGRG